MHAADLYYVEPETRLVFTVRSGEIWLRIRASDSGARENNRAECMPLSASNIASKGMGFVKPRSLKAGMFALSGFQFRVWGIVILSGA
jgi:hypothetical protein